LAIFFFLRRLFSVVYLMTHPAVPASLKALPVIAFLYLIFPKDLFFDFRPFGHVDDLIVIAILLGIFTTKASNAILRAQKTKDDAILVEFEVMDRVDDGASEPSRAEAPTEAPPTAEGEAARDERDEDRERGEGPPTRDLRG
jgi:uncharacterized membrane protein YkvA (DUF1232 family)